MCFIICFFNEPCLLAQIFVCVCLHVCVFVCACVFMQICTYVRVCVWSYMCVYVSMPVKGFSWLMVCLNYFLSNFTTILKKGFTWDNKDSLSFLRKSASILPGLQIQKGVTYVLKLRVMLKEQRRVLLPISSWRQLRKKVNCWK